MSYKQLLNVLFNSGEHCNARTKSWDTQVIPVRNVNHQPNYQAVVINPLNPLKGRCYDGITALRSMIFEIDADVNGNKINREDQINFWKNTGLPISAMVWSGSKSVHVLLTFTFTFKDIDTYKLTWHKIHHAIKSFDNNIIPDEQTFNALTAIRFPDSKRFDEKANRLTDNIQDLIFIGERITMNQLAEWMKDKPKYTPPPPPKPAVLFDESTQKRRPLPRWLIEKLEDGIDTGSSGRNSNNYDLFKAAISLVKYRSAEDSVELLQECCDARVEVIEKTVNGAITVLNKQREEEQDSENTEENAASDLEETCPF